LSFRPRVVVACIGSRLCFCVPQIIIGRCVRYSSPIVIVLQPPLRLAKLLVFFSSLLFNHVFVPGSSRSFGRHCSISSPGGWMVTSWSCVPGILFWPVSLGRRYEPLSWNPWLCQDFLSAILVCLPSCKWVRTTSLNTTIRLCCGQTFVAHSQ